MLKKLIFYLIIAAQTCTHSIWCVYRACQICSTATHTISPFGECVEQICCAVTLVLLYVCGRVSSSTHVPVQQLAGLATPAQKWKMLQSMHSVACILAASRVLGMLSSHFSNRVLRTPVQLMYVCGSISSMHAHSCIADVMWKGQLHPCKKRASSRPLIRYSQRNLLIL